MSEQPNHGDQPTPPWPGSPPSWQAGPAQTPYAPPQYAPQPGQSPYGPSPYASPQPGQSPYGPSPYASPQPGQSPYGQSPYGHGPEVLDAGAAPTRGPLPRPSRRRALVIASGVTVVGLVAGGATLAAMALGGGGPQPSEAVPATAIGYFAVDLDPSAAQKLEARQFARKFPDVAAKIGDEQDLRKVFFDAMRKDGDLKGDWATDVAPWLGKRAGMAILAPAGKGKEPEVVAVLAVTDPALARIGLAKVTAGEAACEFTEDFAVCSDKRGVARKAVTEAGTSPLSKNAGYVADMKALGDRGLAHSWVDVGKLVKALPESDELTKVQKTPGLRSYKVQGRVAHALRFDGPAVELAGSVAGADVPRVPGGAASIHGLPADTVAAVGVGGATDAVDAMWQQVRTLAKQTGGTADLKAQVAQIERQLGISIPGDVREAVGPQVSVAFGGMRGKQPEVAVRLSGDPAAINKLSAAARSVTDGSGVEVGRAGAGLDTVFASSQRYANEVAKGSGLGSTQAFRDVLPDAEDAQGVVFLDIAAMQKQFPKESKEMSPESKKVFDHLGAFGLTTNQEDDRISYRMRVTAR